VLGLDGQARMNVPGKSQGNWGWRMTPGQITAGVGNRLADLAALFGRWNGELPPTHDLHRRPARNLHSRVTPESTLTEAAGLRTDGAGKTDAGPDASGGSFRPVPRT